MNNLKKLTVFLMALVAVLTVLFTGSPELATAAEWPAMDVNLEESEELTPADLIGAPINGQSPFTEELGTPIDQPLEFNPTPDPYIGEGPTTEFSDMMPFSTGSNCKIFKGYRMLNEDSAGAHYYVYSYEGTDYTSAFVNIKLPTDSDFNRGGIRNGFISLGLRGTESAIDVGMKNDGNGWHPMYFNVKLGNLKFEDKGKDYATECTAPTGTTNVIMTLKPVNSSTVRLYVRYVNSAGTTLGSTYEMDIPTSANFATQNGRLVCTFYRFASLVPTESTATLTDGTYMKNGKMLNCQLYNGSNYVSWGINSSRVEHAWAVWPDHIIVKPGEYSDEFSIIHTASGVSGLS